MTPGQGAEYRLHEPGLTLTPSRAYIEGWAAREQTIAKHIRKVRHQKAFLFTFCTAVVGVVVSIVGATTGIATLLK
jgi:hypothetical protein